jgi:hypothetical protein
LTRRKKDTILKESTRGVDQKEKGDHCEEISKHKEKENLSPRIYKGWSEKKWNPSPESTRVDQKKKKETLLQESRKVHHKKKAKPSNIYKDCPYEERKPFSWNPKGLTKRLKETLLQNLQRLTKIKKNTLLQESTRVDQIEKGDPAPGIAQGRLKGKETLHQESPRVDQKERRPCTRNCPGLTKRKGNPAPGIAQGLTKRAGKELANAHSWRGAKEKG